jgi:hypothetical protein
MRSRPDDADLWGDLYERLRRPDDPVRRRRATRLLAPESSGRLIDATLGILGAIRTFVDVAEDILEERRARLDEGFGARDPWVRDPGATRGPSDSVPADEGDVVRDIPLFGS